MLRHGLLDSGMVQKRVLLGGFIIVWAAALQGHMMWLQRQEAFKHKFGELEGGAARTVGQMPVEDQS
jgi:hypothetical protein